MTVGRTLAIFALIGVISALSVISMERLDSRIPQLELALRFPSDYSGVKLYLRGNIIKKLSTGFIIGSDNYRISVSAESEFEEGSTIMMVGSFTNDGIFHASKIRNVPAMGLKSYVSYSLAAIVLLVFSFQFFTNYRIKGWQIY